MCYCFVLILSERKTQEKSQILLSEFFPIHFYYLDIFPHFLRGINFSDDNVVGISCWLNFADKNFLIFWPIIYFRKDQNLQNPWTITVTKNRPLQVRHQKLVRVNFWMMACVSTIKISLYMCCEKISSFNFIAFPIIRTHLQIAHSFLGCKIPSGPH